MSFFISKAQIVLAHSAGSPEVGAFVVGDRRLDTREWIARSPSDYTFLH